MMGTSKGPAKGASTAKPKAAPFNSETGKAARAIATKMRKWRQAHPEWADKPTGPSKKDIRDYIGSGIPDVIDKAFDIALDDAHPKQFEAVKALTEQAIGRPAQAVEIGGTDGAPFRIEIVKFGDGE